MSRKICKCRSCKAEILWFETEAGKNMPVDAVPEKRVVRFMKAEKEIAKVVDTFTPHWATCPQAKAWKN